MDAHKHFQDDLVAYLMGELEAPDRQAMEEHLATCDHCRRMLECCRQTLRAADAIPQIEPRPGFTEDVLLAARRARADYDRAAMPRPAAPAPQRPSQFVLPWAARLRTAVVRVAAIAAVIVIVLLVTEKGIHEEAPPHDGKPAAMNLPPRGIDISSRNPDLIWPEAEPNIGPSDPETLALEMPPLDLTDSPPLPANTQFPDPLAKLPVARMEAPSYDIYAARLYWTKRREALRTAAADVGSANAVIRGLWWLARHQDADGKWDATGFTSHCIKDRLCKDAAPAVIPDEGVTAAALLAMLGDGHTPARGKFPFRVCVARGLQWLISRQQADGSIGPDPEAQQFLLAHAIATAALAEAYGMTGEARFRAAAQNAVDYLAAHDVALLDGSRKINAGSVPLATARMAALASAGEARLTVPGDAIAQVAKVFNDAAKQPTTSYAAPWPAPAAESRITPGMLALLAPTPQPDRSLLLGEVGRLHIDPPDWKKNGQVYWLVGSAIMKNAETESWRHWYQALQQTLIRNQRESGHAIGSWLPMDSGAKMGGRVFSTALSIMALETPYR